MPVYTCVTVSLHISTPSHITQGRPTDDTGGSHSPPHPPLKKAMSYPISSQNPGYRHPGYDVPDPLIPHGVSVAVTAPAVFRFTAPSNPDRHLTAATVLGADI